MLRNLGRVLLAYIFGYSAKYENGEQDLLQHSDDLTYLDKFGISSDAKSLNFIYNVLQQNGNKVEDLSSFVKCTECMPTGEKLSSSDWSYRFGENSIGNSDVFCQFAVKAFNGVEHISYWFAQLAPSSIKDLNQLFFKTGFILRDTNEDKLNISWYFDKLDDGSIKDFNEVISSKDINLLDSQGDKLNISWYFDKLDNGSIKDFNEVIQSKDVNLLDSEGNKLCLLNYMNKLAPGSINDWSKISSNTKINTEGVIVNGHVIEKMCCKFTDGALKQAEYVLVPNLEKKDNYRGNYL